MINRIKEFFVDREAGVAPGGAGHSSEGDCRFFEPDQSSSGGKPASPGVRQ